MKHRLSFIFLHIFKSNLNEVEEVLDGVKYIMEEVEVRVVMKEVQKIMEWIKAVMEEVRVIMEEDEEVEVVVVSAVLKEEGDRIIIGNNGGDSGERCKVMCTYFSSGSVYLYFFLSLTKSQCFRCIILFFGLVVFDLGGIKCS